MKKYFHNFHCTCVLLSFVIFGASTVFAQNYSWDARRLAMGGMTTTGSGNIAFEMVPAQYGDLGYSSIVLPFGLIQVLSNLDTFDPDKPDFDLLLVTDYVGNPFHYTLDRNQREGNVDFVKNIIDSGFSRDLNVYRGFTPPTDLLVEGLLAPNWGYTFKFRKNQNISYQGIYLGVGPYISLKNDLHFDERLASILGSENTVAIPANTTFRITNTAEQQAAMAITGGYRMKFGISSSSSSDRDGVYAAFNFHYLRGFRSDVAGLNLRVDTNAAGLVTTPPLPPSQQLPLQDTSILPIFIDHQRSSSGNGIAADLGIGIIKGSWEFGVGVNGIANRITWDDFRRKQFALTSLFGGAEFTDCGQTTIISIPGRAPITGPALFNCLPAPAEIEKELPVRYSANLARHGNNWSSMMDYSYGFQKSSFHTGGEYRFGPLALRAGTRLTRELWHPTGGIGLNFGGRLGLDVAFFQNSVNLEAQRETSIAFSLRINAKRDQ
ncbi:MAG: hypothetical protein A3F68_06090 [Acidobacteria bacterium RIFCSPLOWO2_12_FULL_54_10]|nr:MAG: hypothetical protein A3F68_06090 [Acidobacteria bacterium RIFCSPLOWO2_12_FULL_54_10]